jgi:hypothetical protein
MRNLQEGTFKPSFLKLLSRLCIEFELRMRCATRTSVAATAIRSTAPDLCINYGVNESGGTVSDGKANYAHKRPNA